MHEYSIAAALADRVREQIELHRLRRVSVVRLRIGRLRGVVVENLSMFLGLLLEGTAAAGAKLEVDEVPIRLSCPACGMVAEAPEVWALHCPRCMGPAEIVAGKELTFVSLEAE
ncbi:hydrogenase maturation nickel metallochaperone HypA [bacterium]|nr:hydrogenase maturation nickel metallochaperone HypA [bacterium]